MKWSQQNNTSKHNYLLLYKKLKNYAKEQKIAKIGQEEDYKQVIFHS